ncbi:MAG TPA: Hsp33 family molecular chaperone HslO [Spongiibacteraceae bacterium]|nr:Hsp33 family molecular chaperone HslO [Spongiibacteraceae bacterium]
MSDQLLRFIFDGTDVRGEWVQLERSYLDALANHHYPPAARALIGEFLAAVSLLGATLKIEGTVTLQARSEDGEISLIMAEATSDNHLRAIVQGAERAASTEFKRLLGQRATLAITIDPAQGQRYQGIVPLEGDHLARCLEAYFEQSEQLPTRVWLVADERRAAGLFLQELPSRLDAELRAQQWQHLAALAETVSAQELLQLSGDEVLYRLFHQEQIRLLRRDALQFRCSCSRERTESLLRSLGRTELDDILREQGAIEVNCEFCNQLYRFDAADVEGLFEPVAPSTRH